MGEQKLTHESRCLVILAGGVLESRIRCRAKALAASRSAAEVSPEDVEAALVEFFRDGVADLPRCIEEAIARFRSETCKAA